MTRRKNQFVNSRGEIIDTDSDECPPGFGLKVPVMLMDSMQRDVAAHYTRQARIVDAFGEPVGRTGRRSGYAFADVASDDPRIAAYADAARRSSDAWRPEAKRPVIQGKVTTGDARADAFATYEERITNAWRSAR
jgi:hypothetical protein